MYFVNIFKRFNLISGLYSWKGYADDNAGGTSALFLTGEFTNAQLSAVSMDNEVSSIYSELLLHIAILITTSYVTYL